MKQKPILPPNIATVRNKITTLGNALHRCMHTKLHEINLYDVCVYVSMYRAHVKTFLHLLIPLLFSPIFLLFKC